VPRVGVYKPVSTELLQATSNEYKLLHTNANIYAVFLPDVTVNLSQPRGQ